MPTAVYDIWLTKQGVCRKGNLSQYHKLLLFFNKEKMRAANAFVEKYNTFPPAQETPAVISFDETLQQYIVDLGTKSDDKLKAMYKHEAATVKPKPAPMPAAAAARPQGLLLIPSGDQKAADLFNVLLNDINNGRHLDTIIACARVNAGVCNKQGGLLNKTLLNRTLLMSAIIKAYENRHQRNFNQYIRLIDQLLVITDNINAQDIHGDTALHLAVRYGKSEGEIGIAFRGIALRLVELKQANCLMINSPNDADRVCRPIDECRFFKAWLQDCHPTKLDLRSVAPRLNGPKATARGVEYVRGTLKRKATGVALSNFHPAFGNRRTSAPDMKVDPADAEEEGWTTALLSDPDGKASDVPARDTQLSDGKASGGSARDTRLSVRGAPAVGARLSDRKSSDRSVRFDAKSTAADAETTVVAVFPRPARPPKPGRLEKFRNDIIKLIGEYQSDYNSCFVFFRSRRIEKRKMWEELIEFVEHEQNQKLSLEACVLKKVYEHPDAIKGFSSRTYDLLLKIILTDPITEREKHLFPWLQRPVSANEVIGSADATNATLVELGLKNPSSSPR